jgi:hypothetical protein
VAAVSYRRAINLDKPSNRKAVQDANRKVPHPKTHAQRKAWMDAYIAAGGEYEVIDKSGRKAKDSTQTCPKQKPIIKITVTKIEYVNDHKAILVKGDDWKDPAGAAEKAKFRKPEFIRGTNGDRAYPASVTWDQQLLMKVTCVVEPKDCSPETGVLRADSAKPHMSFESGKVTFKGGENPPILVAAKANLPKAIALVKGETLTWKAKTECGSYNCGNTTHDLYVITAAPVTAPGWPMSNNNGDHNFFTDFRMKHVVTLTQGEHVEHSIVRKIWESYGGSYDLSAPGKLHPWKLSRPGTRGQCMTICAFFQSCSGLLGLKGDLVFVWPSFTNVSGSDVTSSYNSIAGAWAVASPNFRTQTRAVTSPPHTSGTEHGKYHGTEYVAMIDHATTGSGTWLPGWNNYEATFRFTDKSGTTKYYGGGGPIKATPTLVLNDVCSLVSWCYAVSTGKVNTVCHPPGPCKWWSSNTRTPWPPASMSTEYLRG